MRKEPKTITPDYQKAAIKATETLIKYRVESAPVDPLPILKNTPGVLVLTFEEMSDLAHVSRQSLMSMYGCENQDAVTTAYVSGTVTHYTVAYNRLLPARIVDLALARELGHIVLGHDGTRPENVRLEEARCFAHHLMLPRALVHALSASCLRITTELIGNVSGFPDRCFSCIRKQPGVSVPPELNRIVRYNFMPYIINFFEYQRHASKSDASALADLGTYMDNYEE